MGGVRLRIGTSADTAFIADLMLRAGGGLFEDLLDDILPGIGAEPLLAVALAINQANCAFGYDNAIVAERAGRANGMALCFPAADYRLPDAVTAIVPPVRLGRIEALIRSCPADSFYIHSIAVPSHAQGSGVARRLLHAAAELAAAHGLARVSLHVWRGNARAVALYETLGFVAGHPVAIETTRRLRWAGPVTIMTVATAELVARFAEPRRISA